MILAIPVETGRRRTRENEAVALMAEQAARHGRPRTHQRRVQNPPLGPAWLQAFLGYGEVRRGGVRIVLGVTRHVALQAGSAFAREQLPRHRTFLLRHRVQLLRDEGLRLRGESLEEAHDFADFTVAEA